MAITYYVALPFIRTDTVPRRAKRRSAKAKLQRRAKSFFLEIESKHTPECGAGPIIVLHSAGKRFPDLQQIRRGSV
jgi:hypothetical protein